DPQRCAAGSGAHPARAAHRPARPPGSYRVARRPTDGGADHTGRFWVVDDDHATVVPPTTSTSATTPTAVAAPAQDPGTCPSPEELKARADRPPTRVEVHESQAPLPGFRLDPPPPGATPKVSEDDAV